MNDKSDIVELDEDDLCIIQGGVSQSDLHTVKGDFPVSKGHFYLSK